MARQVLNGITVARPTPTPESQNRPLVASRRPSKHDAQQAPASAAQRAETCRLADALGQQLGHRLPDGGRRAWDTAR